MSRSVSNATSWPSACTPASVRLAPRRHPARGSSARTAPLSVSSTVRAFRWLAQPWKGVPSYATSSKTPYATAGRSVAVRRGVAAGLGDGRPVRGPVGRRVGRRHVGGSIARAGVGLGVGGGGSVLLGRVDGGGHVGRRVARAVGRWRAAPGG